MPAPHPRQLEWWPRLAIITVDEPIDLINLSCDINGQPGWWHRVLNQDPAHVEIRNVRPVVLPDPEDDGALRLLITYDARWLH